MAAILGRRVAEPEGQRGVVSSIAGSRYLGKQVARRCWLRSGRTTGYAARCPVEFDERDGTFRSPAPVAVYENQIAFQSHLVELDDGSEWQIFPGDLDVTLNWKPTTELKLVRIDDPVLMRWLAGTITVVSEYCRWGRSGRSIKSAPS